MPAALEDPTQPPHYRPDVVTPDLEPYTVLLKDRETTATIYPISSADQLPIGLLAFLCDEFNMEIERGDTFPLFDTLHIDTFQNYWFGSFAGVMLIGDSPTIQNRRQWEKECLGTFYIKPNYPGRCAHICTAGFLVNAGIRGKGIGRTLAECYLEWAPKLGYTYSVFNLVFETNVLARRIWETLNFKRIGRIKGAGILKGLEHAVDALIYGRDLGDGDDEVVGELRFDKIRFYLETGRYPPKSDRQEKSRLRSSAAHYKLRDGKLMLKDREVISDPEMQLQIAAEFHLVSHAGINKTTSLITEKYHWTRIKDTVAIAIRNCPDCRDISRPQPKRTLSTPKHEYVPTISGLELTGISTSGNDDIAAAAVAVAASAGGDDPSNNSSTTADSVVGYLNSTSHNHQQFDPSHLQLNDSKTSQQHGNALPSLNNKNVQDQSTLLTPIGLALGSEVDDRLIAAVAAAQQKHGREPQQGRQPEGHQDEQEEQQHEKKQGEQSKQNPKKQQHEQQNEERQQLNPPQQERQKHQQGQEQQTQQQPHEQQGQQEQKHLRTQQKAQQQQQRQQQEPQQYPPHYAQQYSQQHPQQFPSQYSQQYPQQYSQYAQPQFYQQQYQQYPFQQSPQSQSSLQYRQSQQSQQPAQQYQQYQSYSQGQSRLPSLQDQRQHYIPQLQPLHQIGNSTPPRNQSRETNPNPPAYSINPHQSLQRPPPPQSNRLPSISSQHFRDPQSQSNQTTPADIDPQIGNDFGDHGTEDIAIARALISANNNSGDEDENNLFSMQRV